MSETSDKAVISQFGGRTENMPMQENTNAISDSSISQFENHGVQALREGDDLDRSLSEEMAVLKDVLVSAPSKNSIKRRLKKNELVSLCVTKSLGTAEDLEREDKEKLANRLSKWVLFVTHMIYWS